MSNASHARTRTDSIFRGLKQVLLTLEPPIIKAKRASKDWGGPDVVRNFFFPVHFSLIVDAHHQRWVRKIEIEFHGRIQKEQLAQIQENTGKFNLKKGSTCNSNTDFFTLKMYF